MRRPEGKRPLPLPRHRCENNMIVVLKRIGETCGLDSWPRRWWSGSFYGDSNERSVSINFE
jgi:hypothetical protein